MSRFRTFLLALVLAVSVIALPLIPAGGPAAAGEGITLASAPAISGGLMQSLPRSQARPVSYCKRDCENCRSYCYNTYRLNCYDDYCRQSFTLCMRDCWNNICRQCGY